MPLSKTFATTAACLLVLLQLATTAAAATPRRLLQRPLCACPRIYMPVCGTDGQSYSNRCEAECKGATITGQRPLNGVCNTGPLGPVNPSGPGFVPSGPSSTRPWAQNIPTTSNPVSNPVLSNRLPSTQSPTTTTTGPIVAPGSGPVGSSSIGPSGPAAAPGSTQPTRPGRVCACPLIYAPVCGADGKTYATKCAADCIGVSIASTGNC